MRDAFVFITILGSLPVCFIRPWIGILVFAWISYMNPHRYTWGAAFDFPFAKIVAIVTVVGMFLTNDKMALPKTRETILIVVLGLYFTFTNFYALNPELAWLQWEKVMKILIMTLVTMILINSQQKLKYLIMVIAFSIGFLGIKGGIFSLVTGGEFMVFGPAGSFLADNNDMALALNMVLPILYYLAKNEDTKRMKNLFMITFAMSIISVIFTYSRGGFLTLAAVMTFLLLKAKRKTLAAVILIITVMAASTFIPSQWTDRIESIKTYEQDRSAMGRINAWWTAYNLAKDRPLTGGGFETFTWKAFSMYAPDRNDVHDVHSIYFEVLGEHGFVAFFMYLALMLFTLFDTRKLKRISGNNAGMKWVGNYSDMFQISIIAYMVGGMFLGRAYFDLFYHIVAMVTITKVLVLREVNSTATEYAETETRFHYSSAERSSLEI